MEAGEGGGFGWGGVEGWGENADNCNWVTIKTFFKKERNIILNLIINLQEYYNFKHENGFIPVVEMLFHLYLNHFSKK